MNLLFVHQTFPGQYPHVLRYLQEAGHTVVFISQHRDYEIDGIRILQYRPTPLQPSANQSYLGDFEAGVLNGLAVARLCEGLKHEAFAPDIVVGHTGWGELLFVKDVWPKVPLLGYFEFFYRSSGSDLDFDPEFPATAEDALRVRVRNATNMLSLDACDWGHTPTQWQRDQYPAEYHSRLTVVHEGVDTERARPDPSARLWLSGGLSLSRSDQVVTYSARRLEPYRGFHILMRTLPKVLEQCPQARVVIVGRDGVSYGRPPADGKNWREHMLAELAGRLDLNRVHFIGWLPYEQYLAVLRVSSVHVYMTYPFVLSWGLIEAMAVGCRIVASRTAPVEEVIDGETNGYLVDFFDIDGLAGRICAALRDPAAGPEMREAARRTAVERFELKTVCLPAHLSLLHRLSGIDPRSRAHPRPAGRPAAATAG